MGTSPLNPSRRVHCPVCGTERLQLRSEPDRIDRLQQTPSDRVRRLFTADMQLYHCRVCRLQFYDVAQAVEPAIQQAAEPAAEQIAIADPAAAGPTLIGPTMTIRGRLSSQEDIVVHGLIEGDIRIPAHRLIVGLDGCVRGNVLAAEVLALGTVEGNVEARRTFAIRATASMNGDIHTPSLSIDEGALIKGSIETA